MFECETRSLSIQTYDRKPSVTVVSRFELLIIALFHVQDYIHIMGGTASKQQNDDEKGTHFAQKIKANISDEFYKRAMLQREVQMALNVAKARDTFQIFGSAWLTLLTGAGIVKISKKPIPGLHFVSIPIVVGGLLLGNLADLAYGNKLQRVAREAEYILDHENARFVPIPQAPFSKFYSDELRKEMYDKATPVGELYPGRFFARPGK